jgi:hypothetical protein
MPGCAKCTMPGVTDLDAGGIDHARVDALGPEPAVPPRVLARSCARCPLPSVETTIALERMGSKGSAMSCGPAEGTAAPLGPGAPRSGLLAPLGRVSVCPI